MKQIAGISARHKDALEPVDNTPWATLKGRLQTTPDHLGGLSDAHPKNGRSSSAEKRMLFNLRRGARVVEWGGLENRCALAYPGFESLSLRHFFALPALRPT